MIGWLILRRVAQMIPVVLGISIITFLLIYYLPADPARMYAGPSATAETVARIRQELGLDDPFWVQYTTYLGRMLQGDLGFSYRKQAPVLELIAGRIPYTLALIAAGIFVELLIGLPVGIISALAHGRWPDRLGMLVALLGVSVPSFWLGLMLLYWFGYRLPLFPLGGASGPSSIVLPAIAAGLGGAAWYARMMRSSMLDVLSNDYVRTAHAKGLARLRVVGRHVLPNALNPIITMAGMDIPWFIGGVVLVERIFNWPGVGRLAVEAIETVDVPLILGTVIFTACVVVISGIFIDVAQSLVDPRIRYTRSQY
ncbi:MAG TPA: ABC transporter permease [Caldilineaceae bacterium]|nr:ABC transporter permease [Caldilineaceae bacterium]